VSIEWVAPRVPSSVQQLIDAGHARRLAELLALRGIEDPVAARRFLNPSAADLADSSLLDGFAAVVDRLFAVGDGEAVRLVGDYDADGVSSTALLTAVLESRGAVVSTRIPRRDDEGYGLQAVHIREASDAGIGLVVALDSGTNATDAFEEAERRGIEVIVIDHHLVETAPPKRVLMVNPKRNGSRFVSADLTTAGLALRIAAALLERSGREVPWAALARIACLGTIADVAPLRGDNRIIAALGLDALPATRSPGLRALVGLAGVNGKPRAADVAFRIAPRINAAGRLADAAEALELLLTRDPGRGRELAQRLERYNQQRQKIEQRILTRARDLAAPDPGAPPALAIAWHEEWHRGVVGICAARLARELHRPTLLLAVEGDLAVGSGRSIGELPLHDLLRPWAHRLERFGGHSLAVGLTVRRDRLEELRDAWQEAAAEWLPELERRRLTYDLELGLEEVDAALLGYLEALEPTGAGNREPLFRFGPCRLASPVRGFGRAHAAFEVAEPKGGPALPVVAWRWGERADTGFPGIFEMLAAVEPDPYRGGPRLRLVDLRPCSQVPND